jgi:CelD/BcsL family acetyltransferase involved in cellulose biosynthesis
VEQTRTFAEIRSEWSSLVESGHSVFSTWEWCEAWWTRFGKGRSLLLHACRSADGRLVAVLPLYVWRERRPRVLRFLGHGPGDELGPVYAPGTEHIAAGCLRAALDALRWDVFFGEQLPGDEAWSDLLGTDTWRQEASPVVHVPPGGWEEYLAGRSSNFRAQLARRQRSLEDAGSPRFRLANETTLDRDLDALFALHRSRWGSHPTDFGDSTFHREVARIALERRWLRLWFLELDGRPVAAWHGFHVGDVTSYYQAGRDPAYERLSLGFILLAHTLRAAIAEGANEYRLGRGAEAFKYRFTAEDPCLETVALSRGRLGRLALGCGRAVQHLRGRRRRRKHGSTAKAGAHRQARAALGPNGISTRRAP